jgi:hypothetical protein
MLLFTFDRYFCEQVERDAIVRGAERLNLGVGARLLFAEVVSRER